MTVSLIFQYFFNISQKAWLVHMQPTFVISHDFEATKNSCDIRVLVYFVLKQQIFISHG